MTEDLAETLAGLQRAMAAPLPSPEEMAAGKEQDRATAERICKARPGIPMHHAYAVLETLRVLQRVDTAKAEPAPAEGDLYFCPTAREVESVTGGGFDNCCAHPELHTAMPDGEATAAVSQALSDAAKEQFALQQALATIREYLELSDDTGIRTREHLLGILDQAGVPSVVGAELAEMDDHSYRDMVNAPLHPETIAAINERIWSGDYPVRKVRKRTTGNDGPPERELSLPQVMALHSLTGKLIDQAQADRWEAAGRCGVCGFDGDRSGCPDCGGGSVSPDR